MRFFGGGYVLFCLVVFGFFFKTICFSGFSIHPAPDSAGGSKPLLHFEAPHHSSIYMYKYVAGPANSVFSHRGNVYGSVESLLPVSLRSRQPKAVLKPELSGQAALLKAVSFANGAWAMRRDGMQFRCRARCRWMLCHSPLRSPRGTRVAELPAQQTKALPTREIGPSLGRPSIPLPGPGAPCLLPPGRRSGGEPRARRGPRGERGGG